MSIKSLQATVGSMRSQTIPELLSCRPRLSGSVMHQTTDE